MSKFKELKGWLIEKNVNQLDFFWDDNNREKIEHDLIFLGLVVMENRLKPQSEGKPISLFLTLLQNIPIQAC